MTDGSNTTKQSKPDALIYILIALFSIVAIIGTVFHYLRQAGIIDFSFVDLFNPSSEVNILREVCQDGHKILYRKPENANSFIVECKAFESYEYNYAYYSLTVPDAKEKANRHSLYGTYLGETNREINLYLGDYNYIYRKSDHESVYDYLLLFVEANSEEEAVDAVIADLWTYIDEELSRYYSRPLDIAIYYASDLSDIKEIKDYIALTYFDETIPVFPRGQHFGDYSIYTEVRDQSMKDPTAHPDLYAKKAVIEAAIENRHAYFKLSAYGNTSVQKMNINDLANELRHSFKH